MPRNITSLKGLASVVIVLSSFVYFLIPAKAADNLVNPHIEFSAPNFPWSPENEDSAVNPAYYAGDASTATGDPFNSTDPSGVVYTFKFGVASEIGEGKGVWLWLTNDEHHYGGPGHGDHFPDNSCRIEWNLGTPEKIMPPPETCMEAFYDDANTWDRDIFKFDIQAGYKLVPGIAYEIKIINAVNPLKADLAEGSDIEPFTIDVRNHEDYHQDIKWYGGTVCGDAGCLLKQILNFLTGLVNFVINIIGTVISIFVGFLLLIASTVLSLTMLLTDGLHYPVASNEPARIGFEVSLGFTNIGFVLGMIYIGFSTMFRKEKSGIKVLPRLILTALLINFSLFFASELITFSDLVGRGLARSIGVAADFGDWGGVFSDYFNSMMSGIGTVLGETSFGTGILGNLVGVILTAVFGIMAFIALMIVAVMLLIRYLFFTFLIILMPLALLAGIFPNLGNYWQKWLSQFTKWLFYFPITMFFLALAFKIVQASADHDPSKLGFGLIIEILVVIGIMIGGIMVAEKFHLDYAKAGSKIGQIMARRLSGANRMAGIVGRRWGPGKKIAEQAAGLSGAVTSGVGGAVDKAKRLIEFQETPKAIGTIAGIAKPGVEAAKGAAGKATTIPASQVTIITDAATIKAGEVKKPEEASKKASEGAKETVEGVTIKTVKEAPQPGTPSEGQEAPVEGAARDQAPTEEPKTRLGKLVSLPGKLMQQRRDALEKEGEVKGLGDLWRRYAMDITPKSYEESLEEKREEGKPTTFRESIGYTAQRYSAAGKKQSIMKVIAEELKGGPLKTFFETKNPEDLELKAIEGHLKKMDEGIKEMVGEIRKLEGGKRDLDVNIQINKNKIKTGRDENGLVIPAAEIERLKVVVAQDEITSLRAGNTIAQKKDKLADARDARQKEKEKRGYVKEHINDHKGGHGGEKAHAAEPAHEPAPAAGGGGGGHGGH